MDSSARTRLVVLSSFRRGVGKSTLAANLAALAAVSHKQVGLVDTCFSSPALHIFFGLDKQERSTSFNDFLLGRQTLAQCSVDVTGRLGPAPAGRLTLFPASRRSEVMLASLQSPYNLAQLTEGVRSLSHTLRLDLLVIDSPAGISESNLSLLALADTALIVLHPTAPDFQGTAVLVDVARRLEVPQIQLVVNGVAAAYALDVVKTQTAEALGCPVIAVLPHTDALLASGSASLMALHPPESLSQPFRDLVSGCLSPAGNAAG